MATPDLVRQLVMFSLHGEQYALPIQAVREIIRYTKPTATAAATGMVQGMIALRGRVVPVVDLSSTLGRAPEITAHTMILVMELQRGELGLIVDNVDGVVDVRAEQIARVPVPVIHQGLGEEIATVEDRLVTLIEPEQALGATLGPPKPRRRAAAKPADAKPASTVRAPRRRRPAGDA